MSCIQFSGKTVVKSLWVLAYRKNSRRWLHRYIYFNNRISVSVGDCIKIGSLPVNKKIARSLWKVASCKCSILDRYRVATVATRRWNAANEVINKKIKILPNYTSKTVILSCELCLVSPAIKTTFSVRSNIMVRWLRIQRFVLIFITAPNKNQQTCRPSLLQQA